MRCQLLATAKVRCLVGRHDARRAGRRRLHGDSHCLNQRTSNSHANRLWQRLHNHADRLGKELLVTVLAFPAPQVNQVRGRFSSRRLVPQLLLRGR